MELFEELRRIYPPHALLTEPAQLAAYECDGLTSLRQRPLAVVFPTSTEQVVQTLRLCHRLEVPFVARGSGTSLSGGSVPVPGGIVVALNRMNRILQLDPDNLRAVVQPGVINSQVSQAAAPYGLYYAPDPSSQAVCTIGGNVAFNSGGAHCLKYGMTSNHVLALKVVLPDGELVELGAPSLEVPGPDLVGLFVGSEGLMGVAVEITVRLLPRPEAVRTLLAGYLSLEAAGQAVAQVVRSGLLPAAMEIMDRLSMQAARAAVQADYPEEAQALLLVELDGPRSEVEADFERLVEVIRASGPTTVRVARDEEERLQLWKGRKSAFSAAGRLSPDYLVQDGVVPRSRLGQTLRAIEELSRAHGLPVANVFHAGDGNLHPLILYDGRQAGALERAEALAAEILRLCIRQGGSITGEHGVGLEKRRFLAEMFDPADVETMRRIRRAVDPREIANRGKMFPDEPPAARPARMPAGSAGAAAALLSPASTETTALMPASTETAALMLVSTETVALTPAAVEAAVLAPASVEEAAEMVRLCRRVVPRGGGTKWGLADPPAGSAVLDTRHLTGVLEYDPAEFTLTALAGTPLAELERVLGEHGQYLPFDPPFVAQGATLGGAVASGLSGPCRLRHGGVRDFILGIRFVDGRGRLVRGGGRVVKNAAGFDLPKLFCGSRGRLGILVEATFKVFPKPEAYRSVGFSFKALPEAAAALRRLLRSPVEPHAAELLPPGFPVGPQLQAGAWSLWVRVGGREAAARAQAKKVQQWLGLAGEELPPEEEPEFWRRLRDLAWAAPQAAVVRLHTVPAQLEPVDSLLGRLGALRQYSLGGNVAWAAFEEPLAWEELAAGAAQLQVPVVVLWGAPPGRVALGSPAGDAFGRRVKEALDPEGRFGPL